MMRRALIAVVLLLGVFLVACEPYTWPDDYVHDCPGNSTSVRSGQQYLIDLVNNWRADHGLSRQYCNAWAQEKAQNHSEDLAREGRLYHTTLENGYPPNGYWCWLGEDTGAESWDPGEARNSVLAAIFSRWLSSSLHRDVIAARGSEWIGAGWASGGGYIYAVLEMGTPTGHSQCNDVPSRVGSDSAGTATTT